MIIAMARSHILYWLWLSLCLAPGSKYADLLLEYFDEDAKRIYDADDETIDRLEIGDELKAKLKNKSSAEAKKIYYWCRERGVRLLAYDDPAFPERLKTIGRKPVLLYCKGREIDLNDNLLIAMVGTRRMTSYGKRTAYSISYDLARAGAVVVSGMALGVDGVCHQGALDALGDTVAILGCGIDIAYPKENLDLMIALENKGLILTEYKPGTHPSKTTFPTRNRLISGISQGTFVIEGDRRSGAMITARCAREQGRDLFALPGMVGEQNSEGTNALLCDGATPVTSAFDLLANYKILYPDRIFTERIPVYRPSVKLTPVRQPKTARKAAQEAQTAAQNSPRAAENKTEQTPEPVGPAPRKAAPQDLSAAERAICEALERSADPLTADQIAGATGLNISDVMTELTMMEIKGLLTALPGGRFIL